MKYYSGNRMPFVVALYSEQDRDRVRETVEAMVGAPFRVAPLTSKPSAAVARRACALLVFLSAGFARNHALQDVFFDAKSAGVPVIPIRLDDAPMPEIVTQALFAKNSIVARKYPTARSLAQRIMTAEVLTAPRITAAQRRVNRKWLGIAAAAAVLVLAVGLYRVMTGLPVNPASVVVQSEESIDTLGLTQADLDRVRYAVFVGDHFRFLTDGHVDDSTAKNYMANSGLADPVQRDGGRQWLWREDGSEARQTAYDLRILPMLHNLQGIDMALVDVDALPDLSGLKNLQLIALRDCTVRSLGNLPKSLRYFLADNTPIENYGCLTDCSQLTWFTLNANGQQLGDFSDFGPKQLQHFEILGGTDTGTALHFPKLKDCPHLLEVMLQGVPMSDLDFLPVSSALWRVNIEDSQGLTDVSRLGEMKALADLVLLNCPKIRDLSSLENCGKMRMITIQNLPNIRDVSFLADKRYLESIELLTELDDVDFLNGLAGGVAFDLRLDQRVGDYSGLAAVEVYRSLYINAETIRKPLSYLENSVVLEELTLCGCRDLNMSKLPRLTGKLTLERCTVQDLKGLRETVKALELVDLPFLSSLEGAKEVDLLQNITVINCPRLTDWSALRKKSLNSYIQYGGLAVPDFSKFSVKTDLILENIPTLQDFSCFKDVPEKTVTANVRLIGLDGLTDTSGLYKLHGAVLCVSPELLPTARELVKLRQFERCETALPGAIRQDDQPLQLISLEELDTMPPSVLRRMESAFIMGDQVYDPDRYTRVFGTAAALKDAETGEQTRVGQGTVTDMHIFGALENLEALYLDHQPIREVSGIERLQKLKELSLCMNKRLTDLRPVFALNDLETLEFSGTAVNSLEGIGNLPHLCVLTFRNTEVTDLAPLAKWNHSYADGVCGGVSLDFTVTGCTNLDALGAIPKYAYLNFGGGTADAKILFPAMHFVEVKRLDLSKMDLNNVGLKLMAENIRNVEELRLKDNTHITDLSVLLKMETLQKVVVSRNMTSAISSLKNTGYTFELVKE